MPVIHSLADLLHPVTTGEFFSRYWNRESLYIPGSAEKVAGLFSWGEINRVVREHRLEAPQIRLAHESKSTDDLLFLRHRITERGTSIPSIDIPVLYDLLRDGASLVIDGVDEMSPSVTAFCDAVARDLHCHLSVNSYATWKDVPGFGVHWDDHDLFVLQIDGRKHWRLYGATRPFPLQRDVETPPPPEDLESFLWETVVTPGDVIYIPRGHWHGATGVNEATLHLTCGFNNPTGIDLLAWVVDQMRFYEVARSDVPRFAAAAEVAEWRARLKQSVDKVLATDFVDGFNRHWRANSEARTHLSLPFGGEEQVVPEDDNAQIWFSGITASGPHAQADGSCIFEALGKQIEVATEAESLLVHLLKGGATSISELVHLEGNSLDRMATKKILEVLLRHGIVHIVVE